MKKTLFFSLSFILFSSFHMCSVTTQVNMDKGHLVLEITDIQVEDQQFAKVLEMKKGVRTNIYWADGKSLAINEWMGMRTWKLYDNNDDSFNILLELTGNHIHITSTKAEVKKESTNPKESIAEFRIEYRENDTKVIEGFKCIKAVIINPKKSIPVIEMYITKGIKVDSCILQYFDLLNLDGFPLEWIINHNGIRTTYNTIELNENVDMSLFRLNTSGSSKMTLKDYIKTTNSRY